MRGNRSQLGQLSLLDAVDPVVVTMAPEPERSAVIHELPQAPLETVDPVVVVEAPVFVEEPQPAHQAVLHELPQALLDVGWSLVPAGCGWVRAVHTDGRSTQDHFPARHRGLKFVIREIERLCAASEAI